MVQDHASYEPGRHEPGRHEPGRHEPGQHEPGQFVRHPNQPAWGLGQVQSVAGNRVTVNFEHAGKVLVNTDIIRLDVVDP